MRPSILLLFLCIVSKAFALSLDNDSIVVVDTTQVLNLKEVVVKGRNQYFVANGAVYLPSKDQKDSATDAIDLLARMVIPQINVLSGSSTVSDMFGNNIAIFINFKKATEQDLKGLSTSDVTKVEYLESPTDPRFQNADKVINMIVRRYEAGGYTKLSLTEYMLTGLSSDANLFSKFSHKATTFDLYAGVMNWNFKHGGHYENNIFRTLRSPDSEIIPERILHPLKARTIQGNYPVTFRVSYDTKRICFENRVGYIHFGLPHQEVSGNLSWNNSSSGYTFNTSTPSHENTLEYEGTWGLFLPRDLSVYLMPYVSYSVANQAYHYSTTAETNIRRNSRDESIYAGGSFYIGKRIGAHFLSLQVNAYHQHNDIKYTGDTNTDNLYLRTLTSGDFGYSFQFGSNSISPKVGVLWERSSMDGLKVIQWSPKAQLYASFTPNNRNSFDIFASYRKQGVSGTMKSSDVLQQNALLCITGNADLKSYGNMTANLSYGFMPSNSINLYFYGSYNELFDKPTTKYNSYREGKNVLREYHNNGNFINGETGANLTLKLFNRSLILSIRPGYGVQKTTGDYSHTINKFQFSASASYYLKRIYFTLFYKLREKNIDPIYNTITKDRDMYFLQCGWGNGKWNVRVTAYKFLKKGWDFSSSEIDMPSYYEKSISYGQNGHASIALTASVVFGYGKKIDRNNEIGAIGHGKSAVLE